ncbi:MAG: alpha/beta hydrolase [Planctomycetota bacterium]
MIFKSIFGCLAGIGFLLGATCTLNAQTSENTPKLKQALKRFPRADADKDGVLTLDEAKTYLKNNPDARNSITKKDAKPTAVSGGKKYNYKTVGDDKLPLYVFQPDKQRADESRRPAVVFFFGGGWKNGSPKQFQPHCEYLAKRGIVGITVEYRVTSRYPVKVEDCVEDAKSAMRWVRSNAKKLGIDPERIAAGGGSAGGHLAACTSVVEKFDAKDEDVDVSSKPNAMILFNPALAVAPDQRLPAVFRERMQAVDQRARTSMKNISPLNFASAKQPPMIMFFGTEDNHLIGAKLFHKDSEQAGNDCRLVTYEGQKHGFFNKDDYREKTLQEMDEFLVELEWLTKKTTKK